MQNFVKRGVFPSFAKMMSAPFGDGEEYMSALLETGYIKPENVFSLNDNDEIVSVACFFEAAVKNVGKVYVLSYVYTPEKHRGKGFSSRLIKEMLSGADCPVLVFPATVSLFSYYAKFGFSPCAFSERRFFDGTNLKQVKKTAYSDEIYALYLSSRKDNEVYKPKELFKASIFEAEISGGGLFTDGESFAFSYLENGARIITEPFGADSLGVAKKLSGCLVLPSDEKNEPLAMCYGCDGLYADNFLNFNQYL